MPRQVFFLDSAKGRRFAILSRPQTAPVGGVLFLHPFAEELNRSRRMAALAARAFAQEGWVVLQLDLAGCGDSEGDFGDAGWPDWIDDVAVGWRWLQAECGDAPLVLWSLRAGSLLAADWLARSAASVPLLLWQPITNGSQCLTQFLRLRAAKEMLGEGDAKPIMAALRAEIAAGIAVEIGGYLLSPALAQGLGAASLRLPEGYSAPVAVLEIVSSDRTEPSPALTALASRGQLGVRPSLAVVQGVDFWQTQEIEVVPALIECSKDALQGFLK